MVGEASEQGRIMESVNAKYAQSARDADSLKVRLETEDIKNKISAFLKGEELIFKFDQQAKIPYIESKKTGEALVNDQGHQMIMSYVEGIVNKATVMGNFELPGDLYNFLGRSRKSFTMHLWVNMHKYGIKVSDFEGIIGILYSLIEPFMTRTIGDAERATIRETTVQQDRVFHGNTGINLNPLSMFKK